MKSYRKPMCRFVETIRIKDGIPMLLEYHQKRLERTLKACNCNKTGFVLTDILHDANLCQGLCKARIVYDAQGHLVSKEYSPYSMRNVCSLQLVEDNTIDYPLKSTDRSRLNALAARKGNADEIIIVRNGRLTDTSYSNIALFDGKRWFTPQHPLLHGTMRRYLLDNGILEEADILAKDLGKFGKVSMINAMMPLGAMEIPVSAVSALP